jgi:transcriptional regulator of heat shock response
MNNSIIGNSLNYNTNPFLSSASSQNTDDLLAQSFAKLEALKKQYTDSKPQQSTVFTDIESEFKNLSDDETQFIVNSSEYQAANLKYQSEFSQFLINKFSNEYLQTGNTRTLEEMLYTIRSQKEKYKEKFASDINEIRDQNKSLLDKNNQLAESNQNLQKQLEEIKNRLWKEV